MNYIKHNSNNIRAKYYYKGDGGYKYAVVEIECLSHDMQFVKFYRQDGTQNLRRQCFCCGELSMDVKKSLVKNIDEIQEFKKDIRYLKHEFYKQVIASLQKIKNDQAWDRYNDYLNSDKWRFKRKKVLERDNYLCQACLTNEAQEVHHLSYNNIFDEPLYELISVCKRCHIKIEEQKQSKRND
jgi:hypothetical protein